MSTIQLLGSAAAEAIPAIFCDCRVCREAWRLGGKDVRMRTAYKINDHVRVDFGPDTLAQEYRFELHSERLKHLFLTHSHEDHLYSELLGYRVKGFSKIPEGSVLNVYGDRGVIRAISKFFWNKFYFDGDWSKYGIALHPVKEFERIPLPEEDMEFWALPADHMMGVPTDEPHVYAFRQGKSWGLICNDSGFPREPFWEFLKEKRFRFDLVIADACGEIHVNCERGHMGGTTCIAFKERLEKEGLIHPGTRYILNHFSHNGGALHGEMEAHFGPHGMEIGYDGMVVEF